MNKINKIEKLAELIEGSKSTAILSGAGVSTSSGIPDFRGPNGIYRRKYEVDPEKIFDIDFFYENPAFFYKFHREFIKALGSVVPSYTHRFLSALECHGKIDGIVTQNIDALHQMAGSRRVYEIHGSVWESTCLSCGRKYDHDASFEKVMSEEIPRCECGGIIKPDIVFFGESVKHLEESRDLAQSADLFLVLGSSLTVTPAALLPSMCRGSIVVVNKGDTSRAYLGKDRVALFFDRDLDDLFRELNEKLKLSIQ